MIVIRVRLKFRESKNRSQKSPTFAIGVRDFCDRYKDRPKVIKTIVQITNLCKERVHDSRFQIQIRERHKEWPQSGFVQVKKREKE